MKAVLRSFTLLSFIVGALTQTPTFACDKSTQSDLRIAEEKGVTLINSWLVTLQNEHGVNIQELTSNSYGGERSSFNSTQEELAAKIILCAKERLGKGFKYSCTTSDKFAASTPPLFGNTVNIAENYFFRYSERGKIAALIHEATHKCGTNDATYFRNGVPPQNVGLAGWASIADTYEYWANEGLCIPYKNCW